MDPRAALANRPAFINGGQLWTTRNSSRRLMTPKSLEAVCLRAMARGPQRRFETMADLAAAIRHCLPNSARPNVKSFAYRTWRRLFGRE
ncbi:MAG: hypothetical protein DCC68_16705 [Planctomycetota bacterium]|nr:MAG: hypothetical protein DCC68_16705 [Planctomycetota bacterium]